MAENLQSTQVIAKIFGVTTRRVEQLKAEGVIQGNSGTKSPWTYMELKIMQPF